jgi:hypothetical protein
MCARTSDRPASDTGRSAAPPLTPKLRSRAALPPHALHLGSSVYTHHMYMLVLWLHSWVRYAALAAGIAATITPFTDRSGTIREGRADMWGLVLMIVLDVQMLLGLLLYLALSPVTRAAMDDFGAAMRNPAVRFFAVEHVTLMFGAVILAHLGRVLARKAKTPDARRMRMSMCAGLATLVMLLAIPWPGMASGRPLFRL